MTQPPCFRGWPAVKSVEVQRRGEPMAVLSPRKHPARVPRPDFLARLRKIYGDRVMPSTATRPPLPRRGFRLRREASARQDGGQGERRPRLASAMQGRLEGVWSEGSDTAGLMARSLGAEGLAESARLPSQVPGKEGAARVTLPMI